MKRPDIKIETADESHAKFFRARPGRALLRLEAKVLIALAILLCVAGFLLYRAIFVLPPPPPPVLTQPRPVDAR